MGLLWANFEANKGAGTLLDRYLRTASFEQNILTCCTGTARNIKINDISFESPINLPLFNPIWTGIWNDVVDQGGGHYGPDNQRLSPISTWIALSSPNFLTLFLSMLDMSQKSCF